MAKKRTSKEKNRDNQILKRVQRAVVRTIRQDNRERNQRKKK